MQPRAPPRSWTLLSGPHTATREIGHERDSRGRANRDRAARGLRVGRVLREASGGGGARGAPGHPGHPGCDAGGRARDDGAARARADRPPPERRGGHGGRHRPPCLGRGRRARQRHRRPRAGLRRRAGVAVRPSVGARAARRARACRAAAGVGGRPSHRVRRGGRDRGEARARHEPRPLRGGLARHVRPGRLRRGGGRQPRAGALGRAHRARAGHRRVTRERRQGELRHRRQAAARRARRAERRGSRAPRRGGLHRQPARSRARRWLRLHLWRGRPARVGPGDGRARRAARGGGPGHRRQALPGLRQHAPGPGCHAGPGRGAPLRRGRGGGGRVRRALHGAAPAHLRPRADRARGQVLDAVLRVGGAAGRRGGPGPVRGGSRAAGRRAGPDAARDAWSCTRTRPRGTACPRGSAR